MSRCQKPTSARLFGTLRRYELWDPAQPTRGLPALPEMHFEKAHGAPFSWERFQRSTPQTEPESDKIGGMSGEAIYPHTHFHIFASLPGLNGSANNRHRFGLLMNVVFLKLSESTEKARRCPVDLPC